MKDKRFMRQGSDVAVHAVFLKKLSVLTHHKNLIRCNKK